MKAFRHREIKGYMFSNRQMANAYMANVVLGRTTVNEPYKLAFDSSSTSRKKGIRRRYRNRSPVRQQLRRQDDNRRTVVAYGDGSLQGTYKGHSPVPVKVSLKFYASFRITF